MIANEIRHKILETQFKSFKDFKLLSDSIFVYFENEYYYLISNGKQVWKTKRIIYPWYKHLYKSPEKDQTTFSPYKEEKYRLREEWEKNISTIYTSVGKLVAVGCYKNHTFIKKFDVINGKLEIPNSQGILTPRHKRGKEL